MIEKLSNTRIKGQLEKLQEKIPYSLKTNRVFLNHTFKKGTPKLVKMSFDEVCLDYINQIKKSNDFFNDNVKTVYLCLLIKILLKINVKSPHNPNLMPPSNTKFTKDLAPSILKYLEGTIKEDKMVEEISTRFNTPLAREDT